MSLQHYLVYVLLVVGAIISFRTKKLTLTGAVAGLAVGILVYAGGGYRGIAMLASFFVLASAATAWRSEEKEQRDSAKSNERGRTAGQVFANGGVAAIIGAFALWYPHLQQPLQLMMAGSLAAATADTLSSEIGTVAGRRFYNVVTFKKDERGLDGVISLEGTAAGAAGSAIIALLYGAGHTWSYDVLWIVLAGITGNFADSLLGALLERNGFIGNNTVNFLNTATGAAFCYLIITICR